MNIVTCKYLALGVAENNAAFSCTDMRFPNGRHPSVNVYRRFDQRLREKYVTMTTTYGTFSYLLRCCHFHFHFLRAFSLTESCRTVFGTKSGSMLCYAMLLQRLSVLLDTPDKYRVFFKIWRQIWRQS
jgi:hypothetical protein